MTNNKLRDELKAQFPAESVFEALSAQSKGYPPPSAEHQRALRQRLLKRYNRLPPVEAGQSGGAIFETALGYIGLAFTENGVAHVVLPRPTYSDVLSKLRQLEANITLFAPDDLPDYGSKLRRYAIGEAVTFDNAFDLRPLTDFQQAVLNAIQAIPYGEVWTYKDVAAAIGRPKAVRAVGNALGRNPTPLMIPCHRVVASGGKIGGYSGIGGVVTKQRLLALEQAWSAGL